MPIPEGPSLSRRAALALALWTGFYLLAAAVIGSLLFFAYTVFAWTAHAQNPHLTLLACAAGAVLVATLIFWSILPRWERFEPPGPRLDPGRHPRLFEEIRRVARDARYKPPTEVYLGFDVNATVFRRGGILGLFTRRVLTVGLPMLRILTLSQFRGVLAHEFGHYVGGDTRLGPWVHRTGAAIQRTLDLLEGNDSIWRFPFIAYAKLFHRISLAVSQRQELAADALAARVAGGRPFAQALRLIEGAAPAFIGFVNEELLPALNSGGRPPLCEGFARFLAAKDVSRTVQRLVGREMAGPRRRPDRTHPPLPERLEAVEAFPPGPETAEDPSALGLLEGLDEMERELLAAVVEHLKVRELPAVAWDELAEKVYLPHWRRQAGEVRPRLAGITPASFPDLRLTEAGLRLGKGQGEAEARAAAMGAIGVALLVALRDRGWSLRAEPGERVAAVRGEERVEPFHVFADLAEGKLTREAWRARCGAGGFGDLDLGA